MKLTRIYCKNRILGLWDKVECQLTGLVTIRPKKVNYMFLRYRARHFQPPRIKIFYCIPTNKCEKTLTHRELSVQCGRHFALFTSKYGWLVR